ncbi:MAG: hypothetical protein H7Y38_12560, partial [Armatimonadetes bacterium]|nr:hypothetical protein [Armatimonadota bacterium]
NAPSMTEASATVTKQVPAVPLSSFRTGEIRFDADGIVIEGMAVQMSAKWQRFAIPLALFPQLLLPVATGGGSRSVVPTVVRVAAGLFVFAYFVALILVGNWIDKQRAETTLCLSWDSVRAVQTDHLLRSVTLVYQSFNVPQIVKAKPWFGSTAASLEALNWSRLTLCKLEPSLVQGVADTLAHFAPGAIHERVGAKPHRFWLSLALPFLFLALMIAAFALFIPMFYPPPPAYP